MTTNRHRGRRNRSLDPWSRDLWVVYLIFGTVWLILASVGYYWLAANQ